MRLVREVYVFGSFARGAPQPGDVDLNVEFDRDDRWSSEFVEALSNGYDPRRVFRQALVGRKRGVSFMFEGAGSLTST
ncbi:nucleotidyltransferase domain-containing protein [Actinoplanes sp. NPDC049118]|uniref:nucleotidyltransferase domain-containing protein n=1 Tax=Actinoplanes sp. NPDC049118 TaxID=3155769 RepID=UPI003406CC03